MRSGLCSLSFPDTAAFRSPQLAVIAQPERATPASGASESIDDEQLLKILISGNEQERLKALETLSLRVDAEAQPERSRKIISAMIDRLDRDPANTVKAGAISALLRIGQDTIKTVGNFYFQEPIGAALQKALYASGEGSPQLRALAAKGIAAMYLDDYVEDLAGVLRRDSEPVVRAAAAEALKDLVGFDRRSGWIDYRSLAVPVLSEALLNDPSDAVRVAAASALGAIADENCMPPIADALKLYRDNLEVLNAVVSAAVTAANINRPLVADSRIPSQAALILANGDLSNEIRIPALFVLSATMSPEAITALKASLYDKDESVREWASESLGRSGEKDVIPALASVLSSAKNDILRFAAAMALASLGDDRGVATLIEALQIETIRETRGAEIWDALGKAGSTAAIQPLLASLEKVNTDDIYGRILIIGAIASCARNDASSRMLIAGKFGLNGKKLEIWNTYGVLVMDGGREQFSTDLIDRISMALEAIPRITSLTSRSFNQV